jgi:hypothetical protein
MSDLTVTLPDARSARARWAAELHPLFCHNPVGCDGHHLSQVAEVETGGVGPVLLVHAEMDPTGRCTVPLTIEDPDPRGGQEIHLTVEAAEELGRALLAKVAQARTEARMAPAAASRPAPLAAA